MIENQYRLRRTGLTLVEMLMVIAVLAIVTAAAIPLVRTLTADREIREASRVLTTFIESARNDAIGKEFGGILIERSLNDPNRAIDIYKIKRPPSYRGDITDAQAVILRNSDVAETVVFSKGENTLMAAGKIYPGDEIRFGFKGQWYEIYHDDPNEAFPREIATKPMPPGILAPVPDSMFPILLYRIRTYKFRETSRLLTNGAVSVGANPLHKHTNGTTASYEVRRQPVKISSNSITLPRQTYIDLYNSGFSVLNQAASSPGNDGFARGGNEFASQGDPNDPNDLRPKRGGIGIVFRRDGSLDYVFHQIYVAAGNNRPSFHITVPYASINLLVAYDRAQDESNLPDPMNDLSNFWINISRAKGKITSSELADPSAGAIGTAARRYESRRFVRTGQSATGS